MKIAKESWMIMIIGLADLITTIVFIEHHGAEEANPLFKRYWEMGLLVFIAAKLALLVGPLWVLEWARKRNPAFVSWALRSGIAAYLLMYGVGFARLNSPAAHADEVVINTAPAPDSLVAQYHAHKGTLASFQHQRPSLNKSRESQSTISEEQTAPTTTPLSLGPITLTHPTVPISY